MGLGIDILKISRISRLIQRSPEWEKNFLKKCLCENEIKQYNLIKSNSSLPRLSEQAKWLAVRYACLYL